MCLHHYMLFLFLWGNTVWILLWIQNWFLLLRQNLTLHPSTRVHYVGKALDSGFPCPELWDHKMNHYIQLRPSLKLIVSHVCCSWKTLGMPQEEQQQKPSLGGGGRLGLEKPALLLNALLPVIKRILIKWRQHFAGGITSWEGKGLGGLAIGTGF